MTVTIRKLQSAPGPRPGFPTGIWDPAWNNPEVATRVAVDTFSRLSHLPFESYTLVPVSELPHFPTKNTERRRFAIDKAVKLEALGDLEFRGGSFGEIFRKYTFGPMPAANFHVQAFSVGVDSKGRFFLDGAVGMVGGTLDNKGGLIVRFLTKDGPLGGIAWEGDIEANQNTQLQLRGIDPNLRAKFAELTAFELEFFSKCPGA